MARTYRTIEDLRTELSARLGFGGQMGAASVNAPILNSFLQTAQDQIWQDVEFHHLRRAVIKTVGYDQITLSYPDDCDPERILSVSVLEDGDWLPVHRGIEEADYSTSDERDRPRRWEAYDQMEVWPQPDGEYQIKIRYQARCARFLQDGDRASINDRLIFLHALASAKAHYRQPDASVYSNQFQAMLNQAKAQSRGKRVHSRRSRDVADPYARAPSDRNHV